MKRPSVSIILDTRREKKVSKAAANIPDVIHHSRTDDSGKLFPVKLRVTHSRKQRYWSTGIDVTEPDFKEAISDKPKRAFQNLGYKLNAIKRNAENIIDDMSEFSFRKFEMKLGANDKDVKNVFSFYEDYIKELKKERRVGTADNYQCSMNSLKRYRSVLGFKDVDEKFLKAYEKWILDSGNSISTVGIYLRCLRTMFNKAIDEGVLSEEYYPFKKNKYIIPASRNIKKALSLEEVKKIFEYETIPFSIEDFAKDLWIFSYLANGMNMKDIALLKASNVNGEYIRFIRAKTERSTRNDLTTISVYLSEHARNIIDKWQDLSSEEDGFLFPILKTKMSAEKERTVIKQAVKQVNKYIQKIAEKSEINKPVTTYWARHSFSTILKHSGASIEYISEALGHQSVATTKFYLDSFEDETKKKMASLLTNF